MIKVIINEWKWTTFEFLGTETLKSQSVKTVVWAVCVRMISGYQPSLYSCQNSLPRLPVPSLSSTLKKLVESLKPLCSQEELDELQKEAGEFEKGVGSKLQRILILKSWWAPNYVTDWWWVHFMLCLCGVWVSDAGDTLHSPFNMQMRKTRATISWNQYSFSILFVPLTG